MADINVRGREYRVEELAAAANVSVEVLRSYQSKGLLPAPRHEGREVRYGPHHLERLREIRDLKERGYSLKAIAGVLARGWGGGPAAPATSPVASPDDELLTLRQLSELTGVPTALLRSLEASGVLRPRRIESELRYTDWDVRAVGMLLSLLGSGLPMEEFMRVARLQIAAANDVAEGAVGLFLRYIRDPLRARGLPDDEESERMVSGFRQMLEATTLLVAYNFQRTVLGALQAELDESGSDAEREALAREVRRRRDAATA
ncbi:MAG TPA: helix-turn-helix domain-containing protein [Acidimicrobiales bacterium]|nr:helix-turn-helix domain-containing protein [Acidimicrobiales bacterium]